MSAKDFFNSLKLVCFPFLFLSQGIRLFVLVERLRIGDSFDAVAIIKSILFGLVFDAAWLTYFLTPFIVFYLLLPKTRMIFRYWFLPLFCLQMFFALLVTGAEITFFDEFQSRFNFIAVDYLVYTNTVLENIWESYPVVPILLGILALSIITTLFLNRYLKLKPFTGSIYREKAKVFGIWAVLFGVAYFGINESQLLSDKSLLQNEVEKNGFHTLFAAYFNNEIEFSRFYPTLPQDKLLLLNKNSHPVFTEQKKLNVIVVVMESLSARYLRAYGHPGHVTPTLDQLTKDGLFFDKIYATGTRTVRGLEAITLSVPPTPGQSILRRPNNDHLFNIGTVFRKEGYQTQFLYGGYAWFDNMKEFYEGNGFEVVDQSRFPKEEVTFSNAWGVCDEDLFRFSVREANTSFKEHKSFFQMIMTTSNHRPYTYPANKIDIPSGSGRDGAIKYSDFSIAEFLKNAKAEPWFDQTVFIFIADHNASVAGRTEIPLEDYLIPMIFYSPKNITPQKVDLLGSQIDFAPTLLSLLKMNYPDDRFFGHDLLSTSLERAYLATYQDAGYLKGHEMAVLLPRKIIQTLTLDDKFRPIQAQKIPWSMELLSKPLYHEAVSAYQHASELFKNGGMKE